MLSAYLKCLVLPLCLLLSLCLLTGLFLIVADATRAADAIVVIGGDHKPERVARAVALHQEGWAPVVIISAGTLVDGPEGRVTEAAVMRRQALALGLPAGAIILEDQSRSTVENARYTREICRRRGIESLLLVSSAHHSRRARRIFEDVRAEVTVSAQPALQGSRRPGWWWRKDRVAVVGYEYIGWIGYWGRRILPGNHLLDAGRRLTRTHRP